MKQMQKSRRNLMVWCFFVLINAFIQPVGMYEQVADTAVGPVGQCFEMGSDFPAQPFKLLRQNDVEFADQPRKRL